VTGSPRSQPAGESAGPDSVPEAVVCRFCPAPAEALCPRCTTPYCALHGGVACDECARPAGGLPSGTFVRGIVAVFVAAVALALPLLLFRPRLPGEHPPTPSANVSGGAGPTPAARSEGTAPSLGGGTATPVTSASQRYTVQPGDTLGAIAARHGVSVDDLIAANPGIDPQRLQIGAEIVIPPRR
jgi:hypothetical protein